MAGLRGIWRGALPVALMMAALSVHPAAAVTDPVWGLPATELSTSGQSPDVVMSSDGTRLTAVWRARPAGKWLVQAASSTDGGGTWGPVIDLSAAGQNARDPDVATSSDGQQVTVVWSRWDGTRNVVQTRRSIDGGLTWGPTTDLATEASSPQITSSADGASLTAVWSRWDGSSNVVQTRHSADGGATWSTPVTDLSADDALAPQIAGSTDATALTAGWLYQDLSMRNALRVRRSSNGGVSWDPVTTLTAPDEDAGFARLVSSADGSKVTAMWVHSTGAQWHVRLRTSQDGAQTWNPAVELATSGAGAGSPWLAYSSDGMRVIAVWTRSDGEKWVVQTSRSIDAGLNWTSATSLTAPDRNALDSQVASSADGTRLTAVWSRSNGTNYIAQARTSTDGGATWGTPADLSAPGQDVSAKVTSSADGTRVATIWGQSEGREGPVQAVSGVLRIPGFAVTPTALDFGTLEVGTQAQRTVTVTNDGEGPLTIGAVESTGAFTLVSQTCTQVAVPPGGTCAASVGFAPTAPGPVTGTLRFTANTVTGSHTVALNATGISAPTTPTPTMTPTPTPTPQPEPVKQTATVRTAPVKAGASAVLPKRTTQGSRITWKSRTKRICTVKKGKVRTLRKGTCTLRASAPATPGYEPYRSTVRIRVK